MKNTQWIYERTRPSHDQYKVDLCNSICVIVQEKLHRNLGKVHIKVVTRPRVFLPIPTWYDSNHVNRCLDVEHGINHLITDQWSEPLTSAKEITINVNDSQGTLVHSIECE
jgi:hypothetical protein